MVVEARRQTAEKLEVMASYWSTWARVVANAKGLPFCATHLWMIDAFAGQSSSTDPDGIVRGTAASAVLAAKVVQAQVPGLIVHVPAFEVGLRGPGTDPLLNPCDPNRIPEEL